MPEIKRIYGWKKDTHDPRDMLFTFRMTGPLPPSVDLRPKCPPVQDQGDLGSCTANAVVGALDFLELKDGLKLAVLSRLFLYYYERVLEGTVKYDSGAELRDGIKVCSKNGVCIEAKWPYVINLFTKKPPLSATLNAKKHIITQYQRLITLDDMKNCLAKGYPFVFGFTVFESFENQQVAQTGVVDMPKPNEKQLGGHAVCCVGYDDATQRFIVRNSWGPAWGQQGYFTMPYAYLTNPDLASDFWMIMRGTNL